MDEIFIEIMKWILIVLIAGFIGYFGKHAAKVIIAKLSRKKEEKRVKSGVSQNKPGYKDAKYKYKIEKKRLKAEKNRPKKKK